MNKGTVIAIGVSCACAVVVLIVMLYLMWRLYRQKTPKFAEYEKIAPVMIKPCKSPRASLETQAVLQTTLNMKTIPFQVPHSPGRRSDVKAPQGQGQGQMSGFPEGDSTSNGTGSEPSSPSQTLSGSTASSCPDFRGAYSLGSIDPSLYRINDEDDSYDLPDRHIGRIWFAVEYERESEKLLVTLMKAKNLPSRAMTSNNACDPFVRIYLMPDERRYLQSKFKKKTVNPKFEESFVFQVSSKALEERVLKLTVYDVDRHRRHNVLGHALYPLKDHVNESNERVVIWRDLEREVAETTRDKGEINVSLCYNNHLERLTVGVFEGRNFQRSETYSSPEFYVKVSLLQQSKVAKSKKSEVVKRTYCPSFNESFTFKLAINSLDTASVTVAAMQHATGQRDKLIGRVVLGSFMFARGKELDHWNEMVASQKEQVTHWHTLT